MLKRTKIIQKVYPHLEKVQEASAVRSLSSSISGTVWSLYATEGDYQTNKVEINWWRGSDGKRSKLSNTNNHQFIQNLKGPVAYNNLFNDSPFEATQNQNLTAHPNPDRSTNNPHDLNSITKPPNSDFGWSSGSNNHLTSPNNYSAPPSIIPPHTFEIDDLFFESIRTGLDFSHPPGTSLPPSNNAELVVTCHEQSSNHEPSTNSTPNQLSSRQSVINNSTLHADLLQFTIL